MSKFCSIFLLVFLAQNTEAIKVFESTLAVSENLVSGLHYVNTKESGNSIKSMTICLRFNFKTLHRANVARIIGITNPKDEINEFLRWFARYPNNWLIFGNFENSPNGYSSYLLRKPNKNTYLVLSPERWHHACLAFSKDTGMVTFVMVRLKNS